MMEPHIESEESGLRARGDSHEDGAAHLRRLKNDRKENFPSAKPSPQAGQGEATHTQPAAFERRRSPRFLCNGKVELQAEGSNVRIWGSLTDISLHGCYVEMTATFPVDTQVILKLNSLGNTVSTPATIRVAYPFLGMGMCFRDTEPGQQRALEQLIRALAGENAILSPSSDHAGIPDIVASADPQLLIAEIGDFFKKSGSLSRDQFYQIAKRVRRS
jgi:PilZ domain